MRRDEIKFTIEDGEGGEHEHALPAHYAVCSRCRGHGTHLTPSIGLHAYSPEEFEQAFADAEDREAYFQRGGKYDVACERCQGQRVVLVVDRASCERDPELVRVLALHDEIEAERRADEHTQAAEMRAEMGPDWY